MNSPQSTSTRAVEVSEEIARTRHGVGTAQEGERGTAFPLRRTRTRPAHPRTRIDGPASAPAVAAISRPQRRARSCSFGRRRLSLSTRKLSEVTTSRRPCLFQAPRDRGRRGAREDAGHIDTGVEGHEAQSCRRTPFDPLSDSCGQTPASPAPDAWRGRVPSVLLQRAMPRCSTCGRESGLPPRGRRIPGVLMHSRPARRTPPCAARGFLRRWPRLRGRVFPNSDS